MLSGCSRSVLARAPEREPGIADSARVRFLPSQGRSRLAGPLGDLYCDHRQAGELSAAGVLQDRSSLSVDNLWADQKRPAAAAVSWAAQLSLTGTRGVRRWSSLPMHPGGLVSEASTGHAVSVTRL